MDFHRLKRLRHCCRDEAVFEEMKQFLTVDATVPALNITAPIQRKLDAAFQQFIDKIEDILVEYD